MTHAQMEGRTRACCDDASSENLACREGSWSGWAVASMGAESRAGVSGGEGLGLACWRMRPGLVFQWCHLHR